MPPASASASQEAAASIFTSRTTLAVALGVGAAFLVLAGRVPVGRIPAGWAPYDPRRAGERISCGEADTKDGCFASAECAWCHSFRFGVQSACIAAERVETEFITSPFFECTTAINPVQKSNISQFYTGYHAQSLHNWLNDPNGPMFYNGEYHLFFQYNPDGYTWGNMHWYHVKSKDLLHWEHLPVALAPDHDYDCGGIFSGSATIVNGEPVLTYSVACGEAMINSVPLDAQDPSLKNWTKPAYNPAIPRPSATKANGFRDPTEGWKGKDGKWRMVAGCDEGACMFKSENFKDWTYTGTLWPTNVGFQECPDFYNLPGTEKFVYKGSSKGHEYWVLGEYTEVSGDAPDKFQNISADVQQEVTNNVYHMYDMGSYYASKTFYDMPNKRRVLFGWINYHCPGADWTGIQSFPRVVLPDPKNDKGLISYPIPEISKLYSTAKPAFEKDKVQLKPQGKVDVPKLGSQLDIKMTLTLDQSRKNGDGSEVEVHVLVDPDSNSYQTITLSVSDEGSCVNDGCFDMYDSDYELEVRILVDRSIAEVFVQGGRASYSMPYCTNAPKNLDGNVMGVAVVNKGSTIVDVHDFVIFQVETANVRP